MQPIKLKRKSWHYWLASEFGDLNWNVDSGDFCTYVKEVIKGGAIFLILLGGAIGLAYLAFCSLRDLFNVARHYWFAGPPAAITFAGSFMIGITIIFAILFCFAAIQNWRYDYKIKRLQGIKEPSFLSQAVNSIRNRVCAKFELE
jgi:hypothetical protein